MFHKTSLTTPVAARRVLVAAVLAAAGAASSAQVSFRATTDDTYKAMSRAELRDAASVAASKGAKSYVVVSFDRPLLDAEKAAAKNRGLTLLSYLGGNNWIAALSGASDAGALSATPALVNLREMDPQWKLETTLAQGNPPSWTVLDAAQDPEDIVIPRAAAEKSDPLVAVYVNFQADVSLSREARDILRAMKIEARSFVDSTNLVVAHARLSQVRELIQRPEVMWVEPAEPAWSELNNSNRVRTQAEEVQAAPYGLSGAGVNVMVYDGGGVRQSHETFRGEGGQRVISGDGDGVSDHSTHVAGTIAGRGESGTGLHRGMAPDAQIISYGFENPDGSPLSQGFLYTNPGDLNLDYNEAINVHGAHLSNNSIGSNTAPNGFPCDWEGNYGNTAALIDTVARGSLGRKMIMVWAAGNERQGSRRCGSTYGTTAPPGNAKNHIAVGALNSNDDSVTDFTSWGPDDAGRMRPDISAPGCQNGADSTGPNDTGVTSSGSSGDTTYNTKCGTSMAAPTVAGCVALLLEDWRLNFSGEPDPLPSTVKTLLAHNAVDVAQPGPDNQSGYGSVRIKDTIDFMRSGNFAEGEVSQGGQYSVLVYVAPGDPEFKATIAWDDAPAAVFASPTLVNNLDLVVIDPNGNRQYPWTLNPANPGANAVRTQPNTLDNIEQVFVPNPTPGVWQVNVVGTNVPVGPQTFSLAASPLLVNCSTAGIAALDRQVYQCGADLALRVSDCDLNLNDNVVETVVVLVTSDSDPVGEMVVLTETGPLTADFRGSLATANSDSAGVLRTQDGDTITLTYVDADDGFGNTNVTVTDTASVDCAPPMIAGVSSDANTFDAVVSLTTDEPAVVTVRFGESCGSLDRTAVSPLGTDHSLTLTGLTDGTQYFFDVGAVDPAGNASSTDNGGQCFSFTTEDIPTYFVETFSAGEPDLENVRLTFTPAANIDRYTVCAEPILAFDIDPAGGTVLPLETGNSVRVDLTGGETVSLYGESYGGFWVNAPGNITFDSPDNDTTETIADHFSQIRVAGFFDGLNAGAGVVSWKQTADAVAVTFADVEDNFTGNTSLTFQIVMHFDGRIDLNYFTMTANDGLVGLSGGGGTPIGFAEVDFSAYGACGPRPPYAGDAAVQTPANTDVQIALPGGDDGLPAPGMLVYTIESLPANGRLYDSTNTLITAAGTAIPTDTVIYRPNFNFLGLDSFTFALNDGGTAPDGGQSNLGTVDLTVGGPTPVYTETFDTDPGWTTQGQWAFGQPTGTGGDPSAGFSGSNVYGYNLNGQYINNMPAYNLTSTAFDCSGLTGVNVSFYRWLGVERSAYDFARFQVSNDGVNWTEYFVNSVSTSMNETSWTQVSYDISAVADNQPTVYLRWVMGTTDVSVTYHGWNIDDVVISALVPLPDCTGDTNGDGVVNFADLNTVLAGFGQTGAGLPGDINHDDVVNFADLNTVLANFGVDCNK